jgi:hypothetical protein
VFRLRGNNNCVQRRPSGTVEDAKSPCFQTATSDRNSTIFFCLFIAGAIAGLVQLYFSFEPGPKYKVQFGDGFEMVKLAAEIARNGSFANPFPGVNTGMTAVVPPVYPFLLALPTKLVEQSHLISIIAVIGNVWINALIAAWMPRMSDLFFGKRAPGIIAGVLWLISIRLMPSWDASYTVLGLILFCSLSSSWIDRDWHTAGYGLATGLVAGLLMLTNPASILVTAPWTVFLLRARPAKRHKTIALAFWMLFFTSAVVCIWTVRNYNQLGAFVLRTNLGMTLYASNNTCAEPSIVESQRTGCYQTHHPNVSLAELDEFRKLGEVEYDRRRIEDTRRWIIENPTRFRQLTMSRFAQFWFPPAGEFSYMNYTIWIATVFSVPGLFLLAWRRERIVLFIAAVLFLYPLMYYVVVSDVRYRYPILWLSALPAGYFVTWAGSWLRSLSPVAETDVASNRTGVAG